MKRFATVRPALLLFALAVLLSDCSIPPALKPPVPVRTPAESPDAILRRGQKSLDGGKFDDAARAFERLVGTPGFAGTATAYVYLGITNLARVNPSNVTEAKKLRLKGLASFQNALRFDRMVTLPLGYERFAEVFEEAKRSLR